MNELPDGDEGMNDYVAAELCHLYDVFALLLARIATLIEERDEWQEAAVYEKAHRTSNMWRMRKAEARIQVLTETLEGLTTTGEKMRASSNVTQTSSDRIYADFDTISVNRFVDALAIAAAALKEKR